MALKVKTFKKTVSSAGTAEALSATKLLTPSFIIRALSTNTGNIYIGDSTVDSITGMWLAPGESNNKSGRTTKHGIHLEWDLALIYVDADTTGNAVIVEYDFEE